MDSVWPGTEKLLREASKESFPNIPEVSEESLSDIKKSFKSSLVENVRPLAIEGPKESLNAPKEPSDLS
ncbi:hypothetical protein AGMMS49949_04880 [Alphaproteobacteria bacterium]|nr:hypothetical protein AGMMS49949_04880 [Alphaproteobacteria bacterium]GHS97210.1 hypothetical protein AGMMS50296_4010 [Alphaproteobacteria bacterium]